MSGAPAWGRRRPASAALLAAYAAFLFYIALFRFHSPGPAPANFVPFRSMADDLHRGGRGLLVNLIGNVVAFVPFGLVPTLILRRRPSAASVGLGCLALSLAIEVPQYVSGVRVADVDDLLLNTAGGLLGHLAGRSIRGDDSG